VDCIYSDLERKAEARSNRGHFLNMRQPTHTSLLRTFLTLDVRVLARNSWAPEVIRLYLNVQGGYLFVGRELFLPGT
jgi:hypothetical protein